MIEGKADMEDGYGHGDSATDRKRDYHAELDLKNEGAGEGQES
jgi:hypothetical protein